MEKNVLKRILVENREFIESLPLVHRPIELDTQANYVFCGVRRCGKSFMQYQHIKNLISQNQDSSYIYINFEDERLIEFQTSDFDLLVECASELYVNKPVFFFDEIQNIQNWDKFARRLADKQFQVFITGSNAKMLSKEIATTLGGRFLIKEIFPLSFKEYLSFQSYVPGKNYEFSKEKFEVKRHFESYFKFGGFPEIIKFDNAKEYLSSIYLKVFYGDLIARNHIQNEQILKLLIKKLGESVNSETSINRIKNLIKSTGIKIGNNTITDYLAYLSESYLILSLNNYTAKFAERETKKKYYFIDQGILNLFLFEQETKLLENIVFLHLYKQHKEELYYFKRKAEVDFYVPTTKSLVQVCYSLSDIETKNREVKALLLAMNELKINSSLIITYDEEEILELDNQQIKVIPIWKWLLSS